MDIDNMYDVFLRAAEAWICNGYTIDIRYLADSAFIWDSSITLNPLPPTRDLSFQVNSHKFSIGQVQRVGESTKNSIALITSAINGEINLPEKKLVLPNEQALDFYSEMSQRDRWYSEAHLQVTGSRIPIPSSIKLAQVDTELRRMQPPFDGLSDVASWLNLKIPGTTSDPPRIDLRLGPPVDLRFDRCSLVDDQLILTAHAHPKFDINRLSLAVRVTPDNALENRILISKQMKWGRVRNGVREGVVHIKLDHADSALAMLALGDLTIRRQWFIDPAKARNNRFFAVQHFDKELRMVKRAIFDSSDSVRFENGVAALLFLLGFSPSVQLENDAPDLIVTTPVGRLAIVECTIRTSDFATKIGKLVDRRGALSKSLSASGHPAEVVTILVCGLPRDQISAHVDVLRSTNTILITREDLESAFTDARFRSDPDKILDNALARNTTKFGASQIAVR